MTLAGVEEEGSQSSAEIAKREVITVAVAKQQVQEIKPGIPIDPFLKMEPTDLQKFSQDVQVILMARKRTPAKKGKKGPRTPKPKTPKKLKT
jgi:hypothetical protein